MVSAVIVLSGVMLFAGLFVSLAGIMEGVPIFYALLSCLLLIVLGAILGILIDIWEILANANKVSSSSDSTD